MSANQVTEKRKIRIDVTEADIDNGLVRRASCCPIALAARRAGLEDPSVFPGLEEGKGSIFHGPFGLNGRSHIALPEVASQFICALDQWEDVEPFSFEVEV